MIIPGNAFIDLCSERARETHLRRQARRSSTAAVLSALDLRRTTRAAAVARTSRPKDRRPC